MIRGITILTSLSVALSVLALGCGDDTRVARAPNDRPVAVLSVPAAAAAVVTFPLRFLGVNRPEQCMV